MRAGTERRRARVGHGDAARFGVPCLLELDMALPMALSLHIRLHMTLHMLVL